MVQISLILRDANHCGQVQLEEARARALFGASVPTPTRCGSCSRLPVGSCIRIYSGIFSPRPSRLTIRRTATRRVDCRRPTR